MGGFIPETLAKSGPVSVGGSLSAPATTDRRTAAASSA